MLTDAVSTLRSAFQYRTWLPRMDLVGAVVVASEDVALCDADSNKHQQERKEEESQTVVAPLGDSHKSPQEKEGTAGGEQAKTVIKSTVESQQDADSNKHQQERKNEESQTVVAPLGHSHKSRQENQGTASGEHPKTVIRSTVESQQKVKRRKKVLVSRDIDYAKINRRERAKNKRGAVMDDEDTDDESSNSEYDQDEENEDNEDSEDTELVIWSIRNRVLLSQKGPGSPNSRTRSIDGDGTGQPMDGVNEKDGETGNNNPVSENGNELEHPKKDM